MEEISVKEKLSDIYLDLNIRRFANHYFDKSGGWLYHKFDRVDVNKNGQNHAYIMAIIVCLKNIAAVQDKGKLFWRNTVVILMKITQGHILSRSIQAKSPIMMMVRGSTNQ